MGAHFLESCTYSTHTISIKLKLETLLNIITTCLGGFCYSWLLPYWDLLQEIDLDTCPSIYNQAVPVWRLIWSMCMHCRQDSCRGSQKIGIPENRHQFAAFVACRLSSSSSQSNLHSGCIYCFTVQPYSSGFMSFLSMQTVKRNFGSDIHEWSGEKI